MSEELRECPFCQDKNTAIGSDGNGGQYIDCGRKHIVHFINCTKEEAISIWNTRPAEEGLKAMVWRLTQALESIAKNAEFWDDEDDSLAVIHRICKRALSYNPDTEKGEEDES